MPVVTMIAGPNGSGKSTLIATLMQRGVDFGEYLNADDIAANLSGADESSARIAQQEVRARRERALADGRNYSFETVMSHASHLEHFEMARTAGYTTQLFFVATDNPAINHGRVANRVLHGGHDVPADRIEARYHRCLAQLPRAISGADRAAIFDNTFRDWPLRLLAQITDRSLAHGDIPRQSDDGPIFLDSLPGWWRSVLFGIMPAGLENKDGPLA